MWTNIPIVKIKQYKYQINDAGFMARISPAETGERIELPFGVMSKVSWRSRVSDWRPHWRHLANTVDRLNDCAAAMSGWRRGLFPSNYFLYILLTTMSAEQWRSFMSAIWSSGSMRYCMGCSSLADSHWWNCHWRRNRLRPCVCAGGYFERLT